MMNLELELGDGTRLGAEQSPRRPLPSPGVEEDWELQRALLRPVEGG
jgi:hypothetical protein